MGYSDQETPSFLVPSLSYIGYLHDTGHFALNLEQAPQGIKHFLGEFLISALVPYLVSVFLKYPLANQAQTYCKSALSIASSAQSIELSEISRSFIKRHCLSHSQ